LINSSFWQNSINLLTVNGTRLRRFGPCLTGVSGTSALPQFVKSEVEGADFEPS
jgi:hypothetical protein